MVGQVPLGILSYLSKILKSAKDILDDFFFHSIIEVLFLVL